MKNSITFDIDRSNPAEMELVHRILYDKDLSHFVIRFLDDDGDFELSLKHKGLRGAAFHQEIDEDYFDVMFEFDPKEYGLDMKMTDYDAEEYPNYIDDWDTDGDDRNTVVEPIMNVYDYRNFYPEKYYEAYGDFIREKVYPVIKDEGYELTGLSAKWVPVPDDEKKTGNHGMKFCLEVEYEIEKI